MAVHKFRLLSGAHHGRCSEATDDSTAPAFGRVYKAGDIVESEENLVKKFKNKFERVPEGAAGNAKAEAKKSKRTK